MRPRAWGPVVLVLSIVAAPLVPPVEGAGPWRARIVDAATGQPLAGVVVVAYWTKYTATPGGWGSGRYPAADEAVTDPDGRFEIPSRLAFTWLPFFTEVRGPEFLIFKPGYGTWEVRTPARPALPAGELPPAPAELLASGGVVLTLHPLGTREQRLAFYTSGERGTLPHHVPAERARRYLEAEGAERRYLGLDR
jgi:hypothetical protein